MSILLCALRLHPVFPDLSEGLVLSVNWGLTSRHSDMSVGRVGKEGSAGCQFSAVPTTIAKKVGSETRGVPGVGAVVEGVLAEAGQGVQCSSEVLCEGPGVLSTEPWRASGLWIKPNS